MRSLPLCARNWNQIISQIAWVFDQDSSQCEEGLWIDWHYPKARKIRLETDITRKRLVC